VNENSRVNEADFVGEVKSIRVGLFHVNNIMSQLGRSNCIIRHDHLQKGSEYNKPIFKVYTISITQLKLRDISEGINRYNSHVVEQLVSVLNVVSIF